MRTKPPNWSEWGDSNSQHPAPKAGALPIALHPDISFSLPRLVPGIFRVCGHSCGQTQISNQIHTAPKPPVRPCVKAFRSFALGAMDAAVYQPKSSALPTGPHPVISFFTSPVRSGDFSCLWAILWSTINFQPNSPRAKATRSPVCQGVPGFRNQRNGCCCRLSQSRRATSCATPGYFSTHAVF